MSEITVTNYDVLADEMPGARYVLDDYTRHIGNSRFSVLVDMYREAFEMSNSKGNEEECRKIIDRIVGVTCHKDVTINIQKGRFLVKKLGDDDWTELGDSQSNELVRQCLATPEKQDQSVEADGVPSAGFSNMEITDRKRGRRRSLLRRSASESTMLEDKKKTYRLLQGLQVDDSEPVAQNFHRYNTNNPPTRFHDDSTIPESGPVTGRIIPPPSSGSKGTIASHSGMDVVLTSDTRALSTKGTIVGNNRLEVMLSLQKGRYPSLSPDEQNKVATDLVKAVCQYWGGRILAEKGAAYRKLENEECMNAMKSLLSPNSPKPASVPSTPSKPLLSAPPVPEFLRNASAEILGGSGIGGAENMQSAAVKSLQQRKAKRAIAKNLGRGISIPESFPHTNP